MQIHLSPAALAFVQQSGTASVTVASLVFSSCCSGPLAPTVKPGPPADTDGFDQLQAGDVTVFYDSLLDPRPVLSIALKDFGSYRELYVEGWE